MRMFRKIALLMAAGALLILAQAGALAQARQAAVPQGYKAKTKVTMGTFGTVSSLCLYDDYEAPGALTRYEAVWAETKAILEEMDLLLSTSIGTSEIARFNALPGGAQMPVSPMTAEVFLLAREMYEFTEGYFDPTVFPLVDLWGFSPRFTFGGEETMPYDREWADGTRALPEARYIEGLLKLVDMDGIELTGDAQSGYVLHKNTPSVEIDGVTYHAQIDLGGIAKGYAADRVIEMIGQAGYAYGYFSCGSSSIRLLKNASFSAQKADDPRFSLQVNIPRATAENSQTYANIRVMDEALSSSGDYDNNYIAGGNICSHIISPFTGYPLNYTEDGVQHGVSTVTLLSGSAVEDDALTTALCLMGRDRAIGFVNEKLRGHSIIMVLYRADADVYEVVTNIPQEALTILDAAYRIASETDGDGRIRYTGTLY